MTAEISDFKSLKAKNDVRNAQMYAAYTEGSTYDQVAEQFGVSVGLVHKAVTTVAKTVVSEKVEHVRASQASDIQMIKGALVEKVINGDIRATDAYLKVMEREAKLFGTDAASKAEVSVTHELPPEISALQDKIRAAQQVMQDKELLIIEGEVADDD